MKKYICLLSLILITFTSCDKNEDEGFTDNDLIGYWQSFEYENTYISFKKSSDSYTLLHIGIFEGNECLYGVFSGEKMVKNSNDIYGVGEGIIGMNNYMPYPLKYTFELSNNILTISIYILDRTQIQNIKNPEDLKNAKTILYEIGKYHQISKTPYELASKDDFVTFSPTFSIPISGSSRMACEIRNE